MRKKTRRPWVKSSRRSVTNNYLATVTTITAMLFRTIAFFCTVAVRQSLTNFSSRRIEVAGTAAKTSGVISPSQTQITLPTGGFALAFPSLDELLCIRYVIHQRALRATRLEPHDSRHFQRGLGILEISSASNIRPFLKPCLGRSAAQPDVYTRQASVVTHAHTAFTL